MLRVSEGRGWDLRGDPVGRLGEIAPLASSPVENSAFLGATKYNFVLYFWG